MPVPPAPRHVASYPGILCDHQIEALAIDYARPMITPFVKKMVDKGKISYGLSSYGYDSVLGPNFKILKSGYGGVLDPHEDTSCYFQDYVGDNCVIPPHGFVMGHTVEVFDIPDDVLVICLAKSTYARLGCVVGVTPLEPGWKGQVTLEFSNTTSIPIRIYAHEGICQFLFLKGSDKCTTNYRDRNGKYMNQSGVVTAKIL